jgi:hypothetical protein
MWPAGDDRIGHARYFCNERNPRCVKGVHLKNVAREALWAVLAAVWIVGLVNQFGSWPMTTFYIAISFAMVAVAFADRRVLNFAPRRNRRR